MKPKFNNTRDRFVFYAEKRTNDILGRIRGIGNYRDERKYKYNIEDIDKIFNAILQEVKNTKSLYFPLEHYEFKL